MTNDSVLRYSTTTGQQAVIDVNTMLDNNELEPTGYDGHGTPIYSWQEKR